MTGGNRGIGKAIAEAFVANGDQVAVTYRSGEPPEGVLGVRCDVTDPEAVEAAFAEVEEKHGPVEVLVANAGITKDTLLLRMSEDDFDSVVATNLGGAFRVVKRASKGMLRARLFRSGDQRDLDFARKYDLPVVPVVMPKDADAASFAISLQLS